MNITKIFSLEDFKDSIPFTALGARTCYSSGDLNYLLNDPRVVSKEERAKFLSKLGNYKHFSVFAHSFAYKDLLTLEEEKLDKIIGEEFKNLPKQQKAQISAIKIGATRFKSHYNPKYPTVIGISLRHYLEELLEESEEEYFKAFEKIANYDIPVEPLGYKDDVWLIGLKKEYDGYAVFYIDNVSRTMTHQLVRHTTLNFSQRSQRYVKEDENLLIMPPSINEAICRLENEEVKEKFISIIKRLLSYVQKSDAKETLIKKVEKRVSDFINEEENLNNLEQLFKFTDQLCEIVYDYAVYSCKVKREDARFILPHGRKTTIVVSGTLNWIKDFIVKRTDPHAQWEIQKVAKAMKHLLEQQGVKV
ncbi:MAG: thymidylate synthase (FAD) [Hydrogenothermus sp.]|nr:MAG: thymidylate synthase (FAD) [Hydrogenothermus sp.]